MKNANLKNIKKKKNEKKEILWMLVALVSLAVITLGVSVAFFNYTKEGTTENTVTSGTITFLYTEISGVGKGIQISDAYPMTDEQGKKQTGQGSYFDFKITSQTASTISIPYEVTARKSSDSTLDDQVVKLYLTELNGDEEKEILLENYNELEDTSQETAKGYTEKVIYTGKVPANQSNYEKNFRLRMWIDEKTDFSGKEEETGNVTYPYNGKTFTLTVNVYSNGKVVTNKEGVMEGDSILSILSDNEFEDGYYQFEVKEETYPVHMYVFDGNQHWTSEDETTFGDAQDVATATENAKNMVIVKVNGNLTIDEEVTVKPYYTEYGGPKGFLLYVEGTLTNNGTIDNSHGAKAAGQNVYLWKNSNGSYETVPAVGATGGTAVSGTVVGNPGSDGIGRQTGGGASGSVYSGTSSAGGDGTSYSGGTGSGSGDKGNGQAGNPNGGAGGNAGGSGGGGGGGAGNPGGSSVGGNATGGFNGTGGLLIIYSNKLINNGYVTAKGAAGGTGNNLGGSSGGGSINIFYRQDMNDSGTIIAHGGNGILGGNGTSHMGIIEKGTYIEKENYHYLVWEFEYTGTEQEFTALYSGNYKVELYGAQGGSIDSYTGGLGSYTKGIINLKKNQTLYIYVGEQGFNKDNSTKTSEYTFNGGASGNLRCYDYRGGIGTSISGGGATDVRLKNGQWDDFNSLKSRIMVAAGGGGGYDLGTHSAKGGAGGGLEGYSGAKDTAVSNNYAGYGATQNSGGDINGKFGKGGVASLNTSCNYSEGAGGGSGYYGGGGTRGTADLTSSSAAGGSSFISGHDGCDAILETSTETNIQHSNQSIHYSGLSFTNTLMIDGEGYQWTNAKQNYIGMPSHDRQSTITGNQGNGYAKISYLGE